MRKLCNFKIKHNISKTLDRKKPPEFLQKFEK